jgi:hypothetical protein
VNPFDDLIERLEAAFADEEGIEAFVGYLARDDAAGARRVAG